MTCLRIMPFLQFGQTAKAAVAMKNGNLSRISLFSPYSATHSRLFSMAQMGASVKGCAAAAYIAVRKASNRRRERADES